MSKFLLFLLCIGLAVWGFLMWERYRPTTSIDVVDSTTTARCREFEQTIDEDGTLQKMDYVDRFRQFMSGCW